MVYTVRVQPETLYENENEHTNTRNLKFYGIEWQQKKSRHATFLHTNSCVFFLCLSSFSSILVQLNNNAAYGHWLCFLTL